MRISDWSSDVCSSDLQDCRTAKYHSHGRELPVERASRRTIRTHPDGALPADRIAQDRKGSHPQTADHAARLCREAILARTISRRSGKSLAARSIVPHARSEEHTSELQSLMRISYSVLCLHKKKIQKTE